MHPADAMNELIGFMRKTRTNDELLEMARNY
jgi:transcription termination factor Rho